MTLSYVLGGWPRSSVVVAVTNTSTSQRHLTLREEKRDTFVELPDCVPAEFRAPHFGKLRKAL